MTLTRPSASTAARSVDGQEVVLEFASCTDVGKVRPHNEDALTLSPTFGLAVLADGMGGYQAGEIASDMAATLLKTHIETLLASAEARGEQLQGKHLHSALEQCIQATNAAIFETSLRQAHCAGMGTTLVMALFGKHGQLTVGHVGDSRLYRYRHGELTQLTRDHSFLQEQIDAGLLTPAQARLSDQRNLVTRAVGVDALTEPDIQDYDIWVGDSYLLCSDGLTDMVEDGDIAQAMARMPDLQALAQHLIEMANRQGGRDNISALLIRVAPAISTGESSKSGVLERFKTWLS